MSESDVLSERERAILAYIRERPQASSKEIADALQFSKVGIDGSIMKFRYIGLEPFETHEKEREIVLEWLLRNFGANGRAAAVALGYGYRRTLYMIHGLILRGKLPEDFFQTTEQNQFPRLLFDIKNATKRGDELVEELAKKYRTTPKTIKTAAGCSLKYACRLYEKPTKKEVDDVIASMTGVEIDMDKERVMEVKRFLALKLGYSNIWEFNGEFPLELHFRNACEPPSEYVEKIKRLDVPGVRLPQEYFDRYYRLFLKKEARYKRKYSEIQNLR